jgi:hypothetical protein
MLPLDVERCAGKLPQSVVDCPRRNDCARYLAPASAKHKPAWSACVDAEEGDGFIHAPTVGPLQTEGNPYPASSDGVLDATALRTPCALGGE